MDKIPSNYQEAAKHIAAETPKALLKWNKQKAEDLKKSNLLAYGGRFLFSRNHKSAKGKS